MGALCSDDSDPVDGDMDNKQRDKQPDEIPFEMLSPTFTKEDVAEWTNTSLLIPHEPLRSGLNMMVEVTKARHYEDSTKWTKQLDILFKWYNDILYFYVVHHHDAEEEIYFPWIKERCEDLPEKLTKDHHSLMAMMDAIKNGKDTFFDDNGNLKEEEFAENMSNLHETSIELRTEMFQHLNEEEQVVPGLLRKHKVTQQEEGEVVNRILEKLGLEGNKVGLPWIVDSMGRWGGKEMVTEFLELIPGPILFLYKMWWKDHFEKNNKGILKKITSV